MLKPTYKNKFLGEYSREELENDFLENCETLDVKAQEIIKLEQKAQHLSQQLTKLAKDLQMQNRAPKLFSGSQAPSAFRQSQQNVRELQDQIASVEREIEMKQQKHTKILRDISYFQSIQGESVNKLKTVTSNLTKSGISKPIRTRDEIIIMLNELIKKNTLPQMANRLKATVAILQGDFEAAAEPMRPLLEHIGETATLSECIEQKHDLQERENKIEQLQEKLGDLKERYNEMLQKHEELSQQYENEAGQNAARNKEIHDLQMQKETKIKEKMKAQELEIISKGLVNEIEQLEQQKIKLEVTTTERQQKVQTQVQEALEKLRQEAEEVDKRCKEAKEANQELEKELQDAEEASRQAAVKRREAEDEFDRLQEEYKKIASEYGEKVDSGQQDPFEDKRFVQFLQRMKELNWTPKRIRQISTETEQLADKLSEIQANITLYEDAEKQLEEKLEAKMKKIEELESKLENLADDIQHNIKKGPRVMPEYTEGAPSITFHGQLPPGQTDLAILFKTFNLDKTIIGTKPSSIFFVIEFLEHNSMETKRVNISSGVLDSRIDFMCNNDFVLREYLLKTSLPIQMRRDRDGQITEAARSELNLLPLVNGVNSFTSTAKIWNARGRVVGTFTYEVSTRVPVSTEEPPNPEEKKAQEKEEHNEEESGENKGSLKQIIENNVSKTTLIGNMFDEN